MSQQLFRYSEAFKMQVIVELESGKLATIAEAIRRYGIRGQCTVQYWLKTQLQGVLNDAYYKVVCEKQIVMCLLSNRT